jgi:hypothetical protein
MGGRKVAQINAGRIQNGNRKKLYDFGGRADGTVLFNTNAV